MARKAKIASFDPEVFLATVNHGRSMSEYRAGRVIFSQGDAADAVFYIVRGKIKIVVTSEQGRRDLRAREGSGRRACSARGTLSAKAA
jgi:CRP/FNR family transcriptional regulator, cyclic AMP receptor protein